MPAWLQRDWCLPFVLSLGHSVWQGTLIAVVLAIVLRATKTVSVRYWLSLVALLVMAACPIVTLGWLMQPVSPVATLDPPPIVREEPAPTQPTIPVAPIEETSDVGHVGNVPVIPTAPPLELNTDPSGRSPKLQPLTDERSWWQKFAPQLTTTYLCGVALMLLRLVAGLWGGRRLRRRVHLIDDPSLLGALQRQAAALGLKLLPILAYCERGTVPTVVGVLKPMILLPLTLTSGLSPEQIESVLAHELAHLRRYDHLVNLLQRVIESLLFFHPAMWWVSHRIREEREHCCDDLVVACGAKPLDYAKSLLRVAELSRAGRGSPDPALGSVAAVSLLATGNKPSSLRQRISRLLGESATPSLRVSPRALLLAIGIPLVALIVTIQSGAGRDRVARPESSKGVEVAEGSHALRKASERATQSAAPDSALDPTAGLPNSDEETNPTNNPNGDLRSNPAAGSGDPRRAQELHYSETTEIVLSMNSLKFMLDLDSGQTMDPPQTIRSEQKKMDVYPLAAPPKEVPSGLQGRSLRGVRTKPDGWYFSVSELQQELASDRVKALTSLPYDSDEKATYVFRTADGTDGILQLLAQTDEPKGILLRYKTFKASKVNAEIKVGMTFDELIALKGRHYRLAHGMRVGPLILVYDDIAISVDAPPSAKGGGKVIGFEPGLPREVVQGVPYADEQPSPPKGLDFLKPYPKLHGLSLDMTEPQFLEIVKQQELKTRKTVEGEKVTYHIMLGDGHTLIVMFDKDAKCSGIQHVKDLLVDDEAGSRAWQRVEPYAAPSFDQFFPDDAEGGRVLSKLWKAADKDTRDDREILATVRKGLRRTTEHRTVILRWIGNRYIWGKSPQNPDAIEIMYHAADFSGENADPYGTRHYAVYFGLSVVEPKSPAILRTLAELCMRVDDPNDLDRVAWGTRRQQQEPVEHLKPFLVADNESVRSKAEVCRQIFQGELKAFAWATAQAKVRAEKKFASQLPAIKSVLESGSSDERRKILDLILAERIDLILDDSFVAAFAKCAEDKDASVRNSVAIVGGGRWVWYSERQHPDAIKLMVQLSTDADREVRYNTVYYGLSTIQKKSDEVVRRLLEMAFADEEPNLRSRIEWGLRGNEKQVIKLLDEYIQGPNEQQSKAAREFLKQWNTRAGRGSPDPAPAPTAGLPNSDEETKSNNANGDLRSNPAAGSGDPRRAQAEPNAANKLITYKCRVVEYGTKAPIAEAKVVVRPSVDDSSKQKLLPQTVFQTTTHTTDENGYYELTFSPEQLAVEDLWVDVGVSHGRYVAKPLSGDWLSAVRRNEQRGDRPFFELIELSPGKEVTGTVVSPTGEPMPKTNIFFVTFGPPSPNQWLMDETQTDNAGRFRIRLVTPGEGAFWILSNDYAPLRIVAPAERGDLGMITLKPGFQPRGQVLDLDGRPLTKLRITMSSEGSQFRANDEFNKRSGPAVYGYRREAITDAEGRFTLLPVEAGTYRLEVVGHKSNELFPDRRVTLSDDSPPLELRPVATTAIHVRNADSAGRPVRGEHTMALGTFEGNGVVFDSDDPADGRSVVRVPRGSKNVRLDFVGGHNTAFRIRRQPGAPLENVWSFQLGDVTNDVTGIEVVRYQSPIVFLKAIDAAGKSIEGIKAEIVYSAPKPVNAKADSFVQEDVELRQQTDGRWRSLRFLPDEDITVSVTKDGWQTEPQKLRMAEGAERELVFVLKQVAAKQNTDDEQSKSDNANGDLRSNLAAGSGDPRRAQRNPLQAQDKSVGHFNGRVTGPDGKPLSRARVFVVPWTENLKTIGAVRAETDAEGRFEFDAPDMTYTNAEGRLLRRQGVLIATADGFAADGMRTWGENLPGFRSHSDPVEGAPLNLRLAKSDVPIEGRFLNHDGTPLAGARVEIIGVMIPQKYDLDAHLARELKFAFFNVTDYERELYKPGLLPGLVLETKTDADGHFKLSGLGRDRLAYLKVSAPSVVDTELEVMTRNTPDVRTRLGDEVADKLKPMIYGAKFTLSLKPRPDDTKDRAGRGSPDPALAPTAGLPDADDRQGKTDLDPEEWKSAEASFGLIKDREPLQTIEMPLYWRMLGWVEAQPFAALQRRALRDTSFKDLFPDPDKSRGRPARLRLRIARVQEYDAPKNPLGLKKLYEAWGMTDGEFSGLCVVIFSDLPAGIKVGVDVKAEADFAGYPLKLMSYSTMDGKKRIAPLLLGRLTSIDGQPKSADGENKTDNANGDLRSDKAAGSGDQRRAQDSSVTDETDKELQRGDQAKPLSKVEELELFASRLRSIAPRDWIVERKDRAFRLRGPEVLAGKEQAQILLWFDDVWVRSSEALEKRNKSLPKISHLNNTRIGQHYFTRNTAAEELWPEFGLQVRLIEPVDQIAIATTDVLQSEVVRLNWSDAALVRYIEIGPDGRRQSQLVNLDGSPIGITAATKFLVVGKLPDPQTATNEADRGSAFRHQKTFAELRAEAKRHGVRTISLADFERYTESAVKEGRGFRTRRIDDANKLQIPECLTTGQGLAVVPLADN